MSTLEKCLLVATYMYIHYTYMHIYIIHVYKKY